MASRDSMKWTIPINATTSNGIQVGPENLRGILMPATAGMDGASLSIQGSMDGVNYYAIEYADSPLVAVTKEAAQTFKMFSEEPFIGIPWLRVVSTATETAARTFTPIWSRWQ